MTKPTNEFANVGRVNSANVTFKLRIPQFLLIILVGNKDDLSCYAYR